MDTALFTFMMQTTPNTQSVHLIGSWDNFSKRYPMERDIRRSRGQWRGCYTFEDIICDGDGGAIPKRTGGLKMGSTYYYYYELDSGTEHYDPTVPFTTSCPYLPGQPVNLLYVPVEIEPLRFRSASMTSMANVHVKTMNPADKFMSPRRPPPTPLLPRLNTSPSVAAYTRTARSVSPKTDRQWSPRALFSLRSPQSATHDIDLRGRSSSLSKMSDTSSNASTSSLSRAKEESQKHRAAPPSRDVSTHSFERVRSREPSPLRQIIAQEGPDRISTSIIIPEEIAEEVEDDENFAAQPTRASYLDKGLLTQLSPPPSAIRAPPQAPQRITNREKPLPELPRLPHELGTQLLPYSLRIGVAISESEVPRSHFSISTVSTMVASPSGNSFSFSETPSIIDDEDLAADLESGDEDLVNSPVLETSSEFNGYSLPKGDYASEQTLTKHTPLSPISPTGSRTTFGGPPFVPTTDVASMTPLEQLMHEMGYLGEVIVGR